ncbi:unnamed protein product [Onchocerca flexuosa]|uniref:SH2 domain-containing protein n=1 Tax=Onchocerca flexuosa TaxID=387005 RepID=A0A183I7W9_9BILA|nr:unnamed protein product [Onchocerca flexuosa]
MFQLKIVHINFENVCKNYSRYLRIDSLVAAKQYGINLSEICNNYEAKKKAFSSMKDDDVEDGKNFESYFSTSTEMSQMFDSLELQTKNPNILFTIKYDQKSQQVENSLLNQSTSIGIRIINPKAEITYQISVNYEQNNSMIIVRNQKVADFFKLGEISSIFEFHKGIEIDLEKVCMPKEYDIEKEVITSDTDNQTKSSSLSFDH